jgi:hypothetical protein
VLGFLENTPKTAMGIIPAAYAASYEARYSFTQGSPLGILLVNSSGANYNQPLQNGYDAASFTGVELQTYTGAVTAVLNNGSSLVNSTSTGGWLGGLAMNYAGTMEIVMSSCPRGWNASTVNSIPTGVPPAIGYQIIGVGTMVSSSLCSAKPNTSIPQ